MKSSMTTPSGIRIFAITFVALLLILLISHSSVPSLDTARGSISHPLSTITAAASRLPPSSCQPKPDAHQTRAPWLLFTSSSSADFQRRQLIRWSWINTFANASLYEHIFAVNTKVPALISFIKKENETFGDILLLEDLEDTRDIANTIKPFEVIRKLTWEGWKRRKSYDFVSKVDQDAWVDPVRVWERYIQPRIATGGIG